MSHSDDYIIFTSDSSTKIGVDIMKIKLIPENIINDNNVKNLLKFLMNNYHEMKYFL